MSFWVTGGAMMNCSFGLAPSVLMVVPEGRCIASMPFATIMDSKPLVNIMPFGLCQSLANPTVAAATAAALGVLTPMPCIPATAAPWVPGCPTVQLAGKPALTDASQCICSYGGVITINFAGQATTMVP
jgi:hypothetical protein